jgi:hypothetical protein
MGATAVRSESNMGEGQAYRKTKRRALSSVFPTAGNDIDDCGRVPASMGTIEPERGYAD